MYFEINQLKYTSRRLSTGKATRVWSRSRRKKYYFVFPQRNVKLRKWLTPTLLTCSIFYKSASVLVVLVVVVALVVELVVVVVAAEVVEVGVSAALARYSGAEQPQPGDFAKSPGELSPRTRRSAV